MTLIFKRQGKPDTRMIEYDQAIVRLGLEKARAEAELERVRAEDSQIGARRAVLLDEIECAEEELLGIKRQIDEAIESGSRGLMVLSREEQRAGQSHKKGLEELEWSKKRLVSLQDSIGIKKETFDKVADELEGVRKILLEAKIELNYTNAKKLEAEKEILFLQKLKKELEDKVAASENLLSYLSEKEQSLNRKEADLVKYEKRVEKMRLDAGNKIKMKFK